MSKPLQSEVFAQQSSSPDYPNLQTPAERVDLSPAPPPVFGGLLSKHLSEAELTSELETGSTRLDNLFGDPLVPPSEPSFRSAWMSLWRTAYPQRPNHFSNIYLNFDTHDETSIETLSVAGGVEYDEIQFNQLVRKAVEDSRAIRAARNAATHQVDGAETPPILDSNRFLDRYHMLDAPMLPEMPGYRYQRSVISSASSASSTASGINNPDGGTLLRRHDLLRPEDRTELMLDGIEIKGGLKVRIGLAQGMCYLVASNAGCGTWLLTLCVDRLFVRFIMVTADTIALETGDSDIQGTTCPVWTLFDRYQDNFLETVIHSISTSDGRKILATTLHAVRDIGAAISTDKPLSRLPFPKNLTLWDAVASRSIAFDLASEGSRLYVAAEARPRSIGRVYSHLRQCMSARTAPVAANSLRATRRRRDSSDEEGAGAPDVQQRKKQRRTGRGKGRASRANQGGDANVCSIGDEAPSESSRTHPVVKTSDEKMAENRTASLSSLVQDDELDEADFLVAALMIYGVKLAFVSPDEMSQMIRERSVATVREIKGSAPYSTSPIIDVAKQALPG